MTTDELLRLSLVPDTEHQTRWRDKGLSLHRQFLNITEGPRDEHEYSEGWLWLQDPEGHWHEINTYLLAAQIHDTTDIPHRAPSIDDIADILQLHAKNHPDLQLRLFLLHHKTLIKDRILQTI